MASTHKHIRSGTANKRPTTAIADGQIALNTNTTSPGLYFKDSTGASIIKVGPVHVGSTAPNVSPPTGGSSGNSAGEVWLDTSLTPAGVKIWNGSAWVNATPVGSTTVQGLLELSTSAETQAGSDTDRAVTPAGLQSKLSDSTSTTSSTTIASSTAVKATYDLAAAALPKSGGTITGNLEIGTTGSLTFEGATADAFETTLAVVDPTADRTITLPNTTGTVVTTGDTGTVTSTMLLDGTILNADVNASAAIAGTKISPDFGSQTIVTTGVHSAAGGSAATPSITFTGDTNTGIYSPGADQVAISTSGTGRLFVDATGRVIIGASTAAIGNPLEVVGNSSSMAIGVRGRSADNIGVIGFYPNASSTESARIQSNGDSTLIFGTGSAGTERMRLTSAGLLGLGTSSPGAVLDVSGSGNIVRFGDGTNTFDVRFKGPNNWAVQLDTSADKFNIQRNSSSLVTVDSSGRVGIGTTGPTKSLEVAAGSTSGNGILITGSSSPGILISETSGSVNLNLVNDASGAYIGTSSNHYLVLRTNNTERARIDTSGRLLVGTSSARSNFFNSTNSARFQIEGSGSNDNYALSIVSNYAGSTNGAQVILAKSGGSNVGDNTLVSDGNIIGQVNFQGADGTEFVSAASITGEVDGTPGANDMPGRLLFSTTADGAASPTERMRIKSTGIINFSNAPTYADNTAATAGGLAVGDVYKTVLGVLMIRF